MLAGAAACALACASPPVERETLDGWHAVAGSHVRIDAQASASEVEALAQDLAGFEAAFSSLIGRRIDLGVPTTIVLIRDAALAHRLHLGGGVAGYAFSTFAEAFNCVLLQSSRVHTQITMFHEYTHLVLGSHRRTWVPRWYNEGVADFFSTVTYRDGAVVVGAVPAQRLVWLVARDHPMPLSVLFGGDRDETLRGRSVVDFYATSWAFTHYLMTTPRGRGELARFEGELSRGVALDAAREKAFGRSFDALTQELSTHVGYLARGVAAETVLDPRKVDVKQPPAALPLRRGEVASALGLLALALVDESDEEDDLRETAELARGFLEIAVDEDSAPVHERAALGRARALAGDAAGAEAILALALRDAPTDARVLVDAGEAALAEHSGEAEPRFRRAIAHDERSAAAWYGLGRALARSGQAEPARDAFEHARSLGWSAALDLELGRLHVAAHRAPEARALLQPIAQDPHGGRIAEQAGEMLKKLDSAEEDSR